MDKGRRVKKEGTVSPSAGGKGLSQRVAWKDRSLSGKWEGKGKEGADLLP